MRFQLTILGCNAAIPANGRHPSAQILQIQDYTFLIDCGEGTQMRLNQIGIKRSKISQIFISHLHGDHIFGLIGLLTTLSLNDRTDPIDIFSPAGLEEVIRVQLKHSSTILGFPCRFQVVNTDSHQLIFENDGIEVYSLPLTHRIPTTGYLFKEKPHPKSIKAELISLYEIPYLAIPRIKWGAHFANKNGEIIPNEHLTYPAPPQRSYAYCSDTMYDEKLVPLIRNVDMLYHESTFMHNMLDHARASMHSTAKQAATIADQAQAGLLILGHYSSRYVSLKPLLEEAKAIFPNSVLGLEGKSYEIPYITYKT